MHYCNNFYYRSDPSTLYYLSSLRCFYRYIILNLFKILRQSYWWSSYLIFPWRWERYAILMQYKTKIVFNGSAAHARTRVLIRHGSARLFLLSVVLRTRLVSSRGTLHGPRRARDVPGTEWDKGGFRDLITSSIITSTIMHADTTHYAHPLPRHDQSVPSASSMLILQSLSTPLSPQKLAQPTLLQSWSEWYNFMSCTTDGGVCIIYFSCFLFLSTFPFLYFLNFVKKNHRLYRP